MHLQDVFVSFAVPVGVVICPSVCLNEETVVSKPDDEVSCVFAKRDLCIKLDASFGHCIFEYGFDRCQAECQPRVCLSACVDDGCLAVDQPT